MLSLSRGGKCCLVWLRAYCSTDDLLDSKRNNCIGLLCILSTIARTLIVACVALK